MLTGQYPLTHGAFDPGYNFDKTQPNLPRWLSEAGLRTCIAGKTHFEAELNHNAAAVPAGGTYYGFDEAYVTGDIQHGAYLDWIKAEYPQWFDEVRRNTHEHDSYGFGITDGRINACYPSALPDAVHSTTWITNHSIDFISRAAKDEKPFFLWTSYIDPHHPWNPIEPYASLYDPDTLPLPDLKEGALGRSNGAYSNGSSLSIEELQRMRAYYYGMISHVDSHIGRILDALDKSGLSETTLIVFTSDHGDNNGNRRMIRKFGGLYDDLLRVPLLFTGPGVSSGSKCTTLTQHEDLAPTILEALGLQIPSSVQGTSFWPILNGEQSTTRRYSYFEHQANGEVGIMDERWKWVSQQAGNRSVLLDLQNDPREYLNKMDTPEADSITTRHRGELLDWMLKHPHWRPEKPAAF